MSEQPSTSSGSDSQQRGKPGISFRIYLNSDFEFGDKVMIDEAEKNSVNENQNRADSSSGLSKTSESSAAPKWEVGPVTMSGGFACRDILIVGVDRFQGGYICNALDGLAQSIVRDHNCHTALYEATQLLDRLDWCAGYALTPDNSLDLDRALEAARAALALASTQAAGGSR